jgi:GAF domain-containing protein
MNASRDPVARARDEMLERVTEAAQRLLADDASLEDTLQGVASAGCSLLDSCEAASITILEMGRPMTLTATNSTAIALDAAQYAADAGPCLEAVREHRIVLVEDAERSDWPAFAEVARACDVHATLSIPLKLPDPTLGGINFYGNSARTFDDDDLHLAESFAIQASTVVSNALSYWGAFDQAANLALAMEHRAEIEQAKGILMATQRCTADQAFDLLRRASQRENRKLRDIAADLVRRTTEGPGA